LFEDVLDVAEREVIYASLVCAVFALESWLAKVLFLELESQAGNKKLKIQN